MSRDVGGTLKGFEGHGTRVDADLEVSTRTTFSFHFGERRKTS